MVAIILYGPFELAPYSVKYIEILDKAGVGYDLIGWRREEKVQYTGDNVYMYEGQTAKRFSRLAAKIMPTLGYRRYVKRILNRKRYDKLIILTTQTAILLAPELWTKYRGRFIFDYRDRSYENKKPYAMLVNSLITASAQTVISSKWFADALTDKKEYILAHNFRRSCLEYRRDKCVRKAEGERIDAAYIGALRSYEYHKWLIDCFKNDARFNFHIYGCGDDCERLSEYGADADNIFIHGAYSEDNKYDIMDKTDIICYNYPYNFVNEGLVANRYYDCLIMKKPMFVNPKMRHGRFIEEEGLGVGVDEGSADICDKIYGWYRSFDAEKFAQKCDELLDEYVREDEEYYRRIESTLL